MSWKSPTLSAGATSATTRSTAPSAIPASAAVSPDATSICKWNACSLKFVNPEALYEHLRESHVGRKSTKNLNLTCQWKSCHTTTIKRDHMTSHIRVHVPLRPHKCDSCGKSFKRPQDLKKHVKTHADRSLLSPEDQAGLHEAYRGSSGEGTAITYDRNAHMRTNNFAGSPPQALGLATYCHGGPTPGPSSGLFYAPPRGHECLGHLADDFDIRRRAGNVVGNHFGSAKPRTIYAFSSPPVRRSLLPVYGGLALQTSGPLPAPVNIAQHQHAAGGHDNPCIPSPLSQQRYLPPMRDARGEDNVGQLDQILEQIQRTVNEDANQSNHTIHVHVHVQNTFERHHSPCPPGADSRGRFGAIPVTQDRHAPASAAHTTFSPLAVISSIRTPAVAARSSNLSNTSDQSKYPASSSISPQSCHCTTSSVLYPSLPAAGSGCPASTPPPTSVPTLATTIAATVPVAYSREPNPPP